MLKFLPLFSFFPIHLYLVNIRSLIFLNYQNFNLQTYSVTRPSKSLYKILWFCHQLYFTYLYYLVNFQPSSILIPQFHSLPVGFLFTCLITSSKKTLKSHRGNKYTVLSHPSPYLKILKKYLPLSHACHSLIMQTLHAPNQVFFNSILV